MVCVVCKAVRIFDQPVPSACPRAARGAGVVWGVTPCVRCGAKGLFPCPFPLCFGVSRSRSLHPQSDPFGPIVCPCGPLGATCEGGCILGSSPSLHLRKPDPRLGLGPRLGSSLGPSGIIRPIKIKEILRLGFLILDGPKTIRLGSENSDSNPRRTV